MSRWYRTVVTIPNINGVPADAVQNTFAWTSAADTDRAVVAIELDARLDGFYTAITESFSDDYNVAAITTKHYDMTEPTPRFPYSEGTLSVPASTGAGYKLPAEVAVCVSIEGAKASGVNMRRRRGRIFVGPLQSGATELAVVGAPLQDVIADAAEAHLLGASGGPYLVDWAVYSRLTHYGIPVGGSITEDDEENPDFLAASFVPVARMWVDNAWDTQRRRGKASTNRTVRNAP